MVMANVRAYHESTAITEYQEFPGRTHFIIGQEGWQEVADQALDWARGQELLRACVSSGASRAKSSAARWIHGELPDEAANVKPMMSMSTCATISGHSCRVRAYT